MRGYRVGFRPANSFTGRNAPDTWRYSKPLTRIQADKLAEAVRLSPEFEVVVAETEESKRSRRLLMRMTARKAERAAG